MAIGWICAWSEDFGHLFAGDFKESEARARFRRESERVLAGESVIRKKNLLRLESPLQIVTVVASCV